MTCIIAIRDKKTGNIIFGSDRCTTLGGEREVINNCSKVYKKLEGKITLGFAGDAGVARILKHVLEFPFNPKDVTTECYLLSYLLPALKAKLKELDYYDSKKSYSMLIAMDDKLYHISSNFNLIGGDDFMAIGSGSSVALGVIDCLLDSSDNVFEVIQKALEMSSKYSVGVKGPFDIVTHHLGD